ncbi:MAG: energy-coupling factor transporter ATPase [Clostridia bacterium]|nr:energy-coupling factor transporter ATPase [Clostridia bacterium]
MQIISKSLTFSYNEKANFSRRALDGATLTVNEGDFFGIIGETGSGKSTFIQHLNGLIPLQSGTLTVGEFNLTVPKKRKEKKAFLKSLKQLRSKVGMVFQYPEYQLFAETVREDVAFGVKNFFPNASQEEVDFKVKKAIELVGLDYNLVAEKSPFDLSGGQKRRVAIAGVLASEPETLVLDEPVAGLDPVSKKRLMSLLHTLHDTGVVKTVIIVSHDMNDVMENCNRVAVFENGKVVKECEPKSLFENYDDYALSRLGLPVTAYLTKTLKGVGVNVESSYKIEDFTNKLIEKYFENR